MSLRERKKTATLAAIRDAASSLFAEKGYAATTTREIAERAGIATGTLFNYAPSKQEVVLVVWRDLASRAVEDGFTSAAAHADPIDAVVEVFRPIFAFYSADLELGRIFLQNVMFVDASNPEQRAINEGFIGRIAVLLHPHAGDDALAVAINVFAAYYTTLTLHLSGRSSLDHTLVLFRQLLRTQARGWRSTSAGVEGG